MEGAKGNINYGNMIMFKVCLLIFYLHHLIFTYITINLFYC